MELGLGLPGSKARVPRSGPLLSGPLRWASGILVEGRAGIMKLLECLARGSGLSSEGFGQLLMGSQVSWPGRLCRSKSLPEEEALDVGKPKEPRPTCYLKECGYEG